MISTPMSPPYQLLRRKLCPRSSPELRDLPPSSLTDSTLQFRKLWPGPLFCPNQPDPSLNPKGGGQAAALVPILQIKTLRFKEGQSSAPGRTAGRDAVRTRCQGRVPESRFSVLSTGPAARMLDRLQPGPWPPGVVSDLQNANQILSLLG